MEDEHGDDQQCSYCGKWIYADAARCPKCGNYTDGLGNKAQPERDGRQIPRVFVIAGWLVLIAMLLPITIAFIQWMRNF